VNSRDWDEHYTAVDVAIAPRGIQIHEFPHTGVLAYSHGYIPVSKSKAIPVTGRGGL
jgi:hypothetical protein